MSREAVRGEPGGGRAAPASEEPPSSSRGLLAERAAPTFAFPWKLKVRTYSPGRVSLCRMTNKPWLLAPPSSTSWAALIRERVPWNQGKSERLTSASASLSSPGRKHRRILGSAQTFALSQPRAP